MTTPGSTREVQRSGTPPRKRRSFVPKFALVEAGFGSQHYAIVAVSLLVSLLTLFSVMKIWVGVFWSPAIDIPSGSPHGVGRLGGPALMIAPTTALFGLGLAVAVAAGPIYRLCERAAANLLDPSSYIRAVLG